MSLRFLATGDIQAHNWRQFSYIRKDGMNSRLYNCLQVFKIIRYEAKKRDITKVLINGDVLEENAFIETEVYTSVHKELEKLYLAGLDVVLNVGNHDILRQTNRRIIHTLRPFRGIARVIKKPTLVWDHVQVVPWIEKPDDFKKILSKIHASRRNALVLHCGVQGARTGPTSYLVRNPIKLKDIRRRDFAVILLSDYHTRQRLARNVFYLGSPLQHTFGEIHRPCIWEIILDRHDYVAKKIYTGLPEFVRITLRDGDTIRKLEQGSKALAGNYVRVEIKQGAEASDEKIEKYAKSAGFFVQIERHGSDAESRPEEVKSLSPEEAISRYVESQAKERYHSKLIKLGEKIYRGEF